LNGTCAAISAALLLTTGGCSTESAPPSATGSKEAALSFSSMGKMDSLLHVLVNKGVTVSGAQKAFPKKLLGVKVGSVQGKQEVLVDVLIQGAASAIPKLTQMGATIRTVTPSGIMTATVPLSKIQAMAALADVDRMEAAKRMRIYNDNSNALTTSPAGTSVGMNNARSTKGAGVIVGVIDTGLDWTHKDFIKDATEAGSAPETRILSFWDQTDTADDMPPTTEGFTYGHQYVTADFNNALQNFDNTWNPSTNTFGPVNLAGYPIKAAARDTNGHGTHVTGTAAGDGSGSGKVGVAPQADIIFVKFDFDNVAGRNTDAAIIDAVSYVFKKAAAAGKPAVINMSLGTDYGPHDGTSLEERGIDDLTGPGKVVVVAAGNPGANNWSTSLKWGYALHGQGKLNVDAMTFRFPQYVVSATDDDYVFFDVWYKAGNKCRVTVTTPGGKTYPPTGSQFKNTWITGSAYNGFNTAEGGILVGNGGDQLDWGTTNGDHEAYIEISDVFGTAPAVGTWTIKLIPASSNSTCAGTYHAWYGVSDNIVKGWQNESVKSPTPLFGGRQSDNAMTIGSPASASKVIAAAAYMSRDSWTYAYGSECQPESSGLQTYATYPISYYDAYALGELAYFSGRGPRRDGVLKPEIATPGVGIASSFSHFVRQQEWPKKCDDYWTGGTYHFGTNRVLPNLEANVLQGTSMATPNATGAVAALLEQKKDLKDACLRQIFASSARHDAATDAFAFAASSAFTDTDPGAGPGKPNNDWGYGKFDIAAALSALTSYPTCTSSCASNTDCLAGQTCKLASDPCGCNTCTAAPTCAPTGATCASNPDCCSGVCGGKRNKVCK
jgi:subtilisin family serine protease